MKILRHGERRRNDAGDRPREQCGVHAEKAIWEHCFITAPPGGGWPSNYRDGGPGIGTPISIGGVAHFNCRNTIQPRPAAGRSPSFLILHQIVLLLQLQHLSLVQFKNHARRDFDFSKRIVGISGANGAGKTNLLDAVYYLCFTKSYFSRSDQQNVQSGFSGFRISGRFVLDGRDIDVTAILRETGKKEFLWSGEAYEKFSAHIGRISAVMIAPDDVQIITQGSEERRRYLDALLCQLDPRYLQSLIEYNKILQQRNSFLKSVTGKNHYDRNLLDTYDQQLINPGQYVFQKRKSFLEELLPLVTSLYSSISGLNEPVSLEYESLLLQIDFATLLKKSREKDLVLQRTQAGPHKDDINILLQTQPFKSIGSQGQRKSLLFAMKLAEYEMLKQAKGFAPVLLLDDVFEKLDEQRMYNLLEKVCMDAATQIFITDTHPERIQQHLEKVTGNFQLLELKRQ